MSGMCCPKCGYNLSYEPTVREEELLQRAECVESINADLLQALERIGSKSVCACWDVPGMGSGGSYKWIGCAPHNSDDPEEWCLCCIANEILAKLKKARGEG